MHSCSISKDLLHAQISAEFIHMLSMKNWCFRSINELLEFLSFIYCFKNRCPNKHYLSVILASACLLVNSHENHLLVNFVTNFFLVFFASEFALLLKHFSRGKFKMKV